MPQKRFVPASWVIRRRLTPRAFTIVELLVVIAIIAILVALLLPAVQAARESARLVSCRNNAKQLAQGCITHLDLQGYFPSNGWGWGWTGDADGSFGNSQPGGWAYSVLPFIGQNVLHQLGAGLDESGRRAAGMQRMQTPIPTFYCPTRRKPRPYANVNSPINANRPATAAKTDFAINGGDNRGPLHYDWNPQPWQDDQRATTGVSGLRSEFRPAVFPDGMSLTLLLAEKNLNPDRYEAGNCAADNGDAWQGKDWDTTRWTAAAPLRDTPGVDGIERFGGAHPGQLNTAACDGSVRGIRFDIDAGVWRRLGNRRDTDSPTPIPTDWPR
jgi:prepilin-type N-terminal cleavage/methylation domain-containing protein